ncbi:hypothetical protein RB195_006155 [Necator americanus]|uniref:Uncharacterized protein n=1 Tax=Necator americanus TaxID=51031 RepID=A0ABR1BR81_NECAM
MTGIFFRVQWHFRREEDSSRMSQASIKYGAEICFNRVRFRPSDQHSADLASEHWDKQCRQSVVDWEVDVMRGFFTLWISRTTCLMRCPRRKGMRQVTMTIRLPFF